MIALQLRRVSLDALVGLLIAQNLLAFQILSPLKNGCRPVPSSPSSRRTAGQNTCLFQRDLEKLSSTEGPSRFHQSADLSASIQEECILEIDNQRYNLTQWAKAHPGGVAVLRKFHSKDASQAFHAVRHSASAHDLLRTLAVTPAVANENCTGTSFRVTSIPTTQQQQQQQQRRRWQQKLITKEDPYHIHKTLGIFCLVHFAYRFGKIYFGDPAGGFGTGRLAATVVNGHNVQLSSALCLIPHLLLSLSSLLFDTVPRERVVGKPMIWQEYRIHNIAFGVRSIVCTLLAWLSGYHGHAPQWRRGMVVASCVAALLTSMVADQATHRLRTNAAESTTATMPYWDGCSKQTELRFKTFYAFSQFMATTVCIALCNPAWIFTTLFAIQGASLLMTLVRKGFLSTKGSHMAYTVMLIMPFLGGLRSMMYMKLWELPLLLAVTGGLFQLRRMGVNKYVLWVPVFVIRILYGDRFIPYQIW